MVSLCDVKAGLLEELVFLYRYFVRLAYQPHVTGSGELCGSENGRSSMEIKL